MNLIKIFFLSLMAVFLVGCGGGGGSSGTNQGSGGTTPSTPSTTSTATVTVADFYFQLDKVSISNSGSDKATLSVTAVDANRNVVASAPVSVAVDSLASFSPTNGSSTNSSGVYTGVIGIGGDKSNRTITATITINKISKTASISVVGGGISITPVPATPAPGGTVTVNISLTDSAGMPIPSASLTLGGTLGAKGVVSTDLSGSYVMVVSAPKISGTYSFTAAGLGISSEKSIQVIDSGNSQILPAAGTVSSTVLQPQPSTIAPNASGSKTNRSKLSAKFVTADNSGIQNMRVRFQIVPPALGSGEEILTGDNTVYSDSAGVAESYYISGTRASPTNGVKLRICYKATDFISSDFDKDGACLLSTKVDTNLTVASSPVSINIGFDNKIESGLGGSYIKKFLVQVNDSAGVAVSGAIISTSVDITHYGKGIYGGFYPAGYTVIPSSSPPVTQSVAMLSSGVVLGDFASNTVPGKITVGGVENYYNVWCANEDLNRNNFSDDGEDINGSGYLEPGKAAINISYVDGNITNSQGQLLLQVTYPQNMGTWLAYTVRATTSVSGSEGDASKNFVTAVAEGDVATGSFRLPPFGSGRCNQNK